MNMLVSYQVTYSHACIAPAPNRAGIQANDKCLLLLWGLQYMVEKGGGQEKSNKMLPSTSSYQKGCKQPEMDSFASGENTHVSSGTKCL